MAPIEDVPGRDRTLASRQPRSSRVEDLAQAAGEVALSVIPVVGSALQTTFASAANIVSTRRTEAWLAELATEVDRLAARKSLSVREIVEDPAFLCPRHPSAIENTDQGMQGPRTHHGTLQRLNSDPSC